MTRFSNCLGEREDVKHDFKVSSEGDLVDGLAILQDKEDRRKEVKRVRLQDVGKEIRY